VLFLVNILFFFASMRECSSFQLAEIYASLYSPGPFMSSGQESRQSHKSSAIVSVIGLNSR